MFYMHNMLFYIIFGTNLFNLEPSASFYFSLFLSFAEKEYQTESKRNKTFALIFLGPEDTQETWRWSRMSHEAATTTEGAPPPLWAPRDSPNLIPSPIYSHIFPNHQKHPRKHFFTAATFYSH